MQAQIETLGNIGPAEGLLGEFTVADIAEPPLDLESRQGDGKEVTLWMLRSNHRMWVTVTDYKNRAPGEDPLMHTIDVEEGTNPLEANHGPFHHPYAYI